MDYNTAIENVFKVFYDGNAHSRMLNGAQLNQGVGATGLIRVDWAGAPGAADARGGAQKQEKRWCFSCAMPQF